MSDGETGGIAVEEVEVVAAPPRARVDDAEGPGEKLTRKRDYLEGFLKEKPQDIAPGAPGGALYEDVVAALKDIFDPEIPVNIYDLGLIYSVDVTEDADVAVTMTLTTPALPGGRIHARRSRIAGRRGARRARCGSQSGVGSAVGSGQDDR